MGRRRRRIVWGSVGALIGLVLLVVLALPLWFPWVLGPVLERNDVSYDRYERIGYGRFALNEVEFAEEGMAFGAERIEAYLPLSWVWKRYTGNGEEEFLLVENWALELEEIDEPDEPEEVDVAEVVRQAEEILPSVIDWLARARLDDGRVVADDHEVEVLSVTWREGVLTAEIHSPEFEQSAWLDGDFRDGLPFVLTGRTEPFPLEVEITVVETEDAVGVRSRAWIADNLLTADAEFPPEGHLPRVAEIRADDFRLPPEYFEMVPEAFRIEGYDEVTGSLHIEWEEGRYAAKIEASAPPREITIPLRLDIVARGDLERVTVEELEILSPWLTASLSAPVVFDYEGNILAGGEELSMNGPAPPKEHPDEFEIVPAAADAPERLEELFEAPEFSVETDLGALPFVDLQGQVRGQVRVVPMPDRPPELEFSLTGENVSGYDLELEEFTVEGGMDWPRVRVDEFTATGPAGTDIAASGGYDIDEERVFDASVSGILLPDDVAAYLPEDMAFTRAEFSAEADGRLEEIEHRGEVTVDRIETDPVKPFAATLLWSGVFDRLDAFDVLLEAGESEFLVSGSGGLEDDSIWLEVAELSLERKGEILLEAIEAARLGGDWSREDRFAVSVSGLHWRTLEGFLRVNGSVAWPDQGNFDMALSDVDPAILNDFIEIDPGAVDLRDFEARGEWEEGPLAFSLLSNVEFRVEDESVRLEAAVSGEVRRITVDRLEVMDERGIIGFAKGSLPVSINPGQAELLTVHSRDPIDFRAETEPRAAFWDRIAEITGVFIEDPRLQLVLRGTPFEPEGEITASTPRLELPEPDDFPAPQIEEVDIRARIAVAEIALEESSVTVEGETIQAHGALPMGPERWQALVEEGVLPDWEQATGRVVAGDVRLASFARFFPELLAPQGRLDIDMTVHPGMVLEGVLEVDDAATRPLPAIGRIREGSARVVFEERSARVEEISAMIGGERVAVSGDVDLPFGQEFAFDLRATGERVPFTRQAGVVIRGDIDLRVASRPDQEPLIAGEVALRDSLYVAELGLTPTGDVTAPDRQPPFFSVEQEPFGAWELDVELRGPRFLAVRGPVFEGTVSASFDLTGTLEDPLAIGEATVDEGRVRFPFAVLTVDEAIISVTRDQPFNLSLFILASTTAFDYDVQMEITGTADDPIVEFSSNPPLTSEQILLMVTAGEMPDGSFALTQQQRASRFAMFIGRQLMARVFGVDAAEGRLDVRTGERISEGGRETFHLEYELTDRWSLTGEYDRFDEYNAGVKYNLFTR